MISAICLNPSFDRTVEVDSLIKGEVNRIRSSRTDMGGKGLNVAVVASRLGMDVQCIGIMGENDAERLTMMMDKENVRHRFLKVPGNIRTNMKIVSTDGSGVTELNEPGILTERETLDLFFNMASEATKDSDMIVVTGSLPPGCPEGTYRDLMNALENKKIILDTEGKELENGTKARPFLIKPNLHELESTLGVELRTLRAIRDAALMFIRLGAENAVVSMGGMGAMFVSPDKTLFAPALRVDAKSTVGAGDAMIGGLLKGYEIEKDIAKAFRYGVAAGTASVMTEGTQLIRLSDFDRLLDQVRVQEV